MGYGWEEAEDVVQDIEADVIHELVHIFVWVADGCATAVVVVVVCGGHGATERGKNLCDCVWLCFFDLPICLGVKNNGCYAVGTQESSSKWNSTGSYTTYRKVIVYFIQFKRFAMEIRFRAFFFLSSSAELGDKRTASVSSTTSSLSSVGSIPIVSMGVVRDEGFNRCRLR